MFKKGMARTKKKSKSKLPEQPPKLVLTEPNRYS